MLKDLFLPVTGASSDEAVLDNAVAIAAAYGARLNVGIASPSMAPILAPWGIASDAVAAELLDQVVLEAGQVAETYRARLRTAEILWDVRIDEARFLDPADALARQALYADVTVLGRPLDDERAIAHAFFRASLFATGRPVLVVPLAPVVTRFRKVLLAWKPTRETTRAIHDAIAAFAPDAVEVLVVDPEIGASAHGSEPGADIASHLVHHGLRVNVTTRSSESMSVATRVLLHAAETDADLVVAGGYGHARLREWVLGGTTRELLGALEVPVLFSR